MGTEVAISFSSLRAQLENEKSTLYKIDANIKKIVQNPGRYSDRFKHPSTDYGRTNPRLGTRNSLPDNGNHHIRNDEQFGTKKGDTKTVFSRLSARVNDSDGEEEASGIKRIRMSSAVSRELPSRAEVVRAQGGDERARTRNRRIFGSLLGTLQKFKQEEINLQTKEEKKAQVERKIEEQARQQKEKEIKERKTLFAEREHKKATIRALEAKVARVDEFEQWESTQRSLAHFILTKTKPHVYWLPKRMTDKAQEKLASSRSYHEKTLARKRNELQEELLQIEQRCLRPRGPQVAEARAREGAKEGGGLGGEDVDGEGARRRDKFAMDVDDKEKEDSEPEADTEHQPAAPAVDDKASADSECQMDIQMEPQLKAEEPTESEPQPSPAAPAEGQHTPMQEDQP